jgi:hypothetical protein
MPRMTRHDAFDLAADFGINLKADFHALDSDQVGRITAAADHWKYRKPRNANGSRARYFYALLQRCARRDPYAD